MTMLNPKPPSVIDPVSQAIGRTKRILFSPFEIQKWFMLGFCAWLAYLGDGGGGSGGNLGNRFRGESLSDSLDTAWDWVRDHLALIVVLTFVVFVLGILLTWVSSRGKFMFLDGVVHDRAAIAEPWTRFAELGNSLFWFRLAVFLIALAAILGLGTLVVRDLLDMGIGDRELGSAEIFAIGLWVAAFVPIVFLALLVGLIVEDLVVPIMWLRQLRVMAAWREALAFMSAHLWTFVLYVLFKIVLAIAIALISCVATCVTCCIAALPYLGVVLLLPLYVFRRSYSLEFLAQFGPDYAALAPAQQLEPPG